MEKKKYLDLEGLTEYHKRLLELNKQEREEFLKLVMGKIELGKLGTAEEERE